MYQRDLLCLCIAILGGILFLYGSNIYNAVLGWSGLCILVAAIVAEVALEVHQYIRKGKVG
jgi:hypothetical protein